MSFLDLLQVDYIQSPLAFEHPELQVEQDPAHFTPSQPSSASSNSRALSPVSDPSPTMNYQALPNKDDATSMNFLSFPNVDWNVVNAAAATAAWANQGANDNALGFFDTVKAFGLDQPFNAGAAVSSMNVNVFSGDMSPTLSMSPSGINPSDIHTANASPALSPVINNNLVLNPPLKRRDSDDTDSLPAKKKRGRPPKDRSLSASSSPRPMADKPKATKPPTPSDVKTEQAKKLIPDKYIKNGRYEVTGLSKEAISKLKDAEDLLAAVDPSRKSATEALLNEIAQQREKAKDDASQQRKKKDMKIESLTRENEALVAENETLKQQLEMFKSLLGV